MNVFGLNFHVEILSGNAFLYGIGGLSCGLNLETWFSGQGGDELLVGSDDLRGLFKPLWFCDSKEKSQRWEGDKVWPSLSYYKRPKEVRPAGLVHLNAVSINNPLLTCQTIWFFLTLSFCHALAYQNKGLPYRGCYVVPGYGRRTMARFQYSHTSQTVRFTKWV